MRLLPPGQVIQGRERRQVSFITYFGSDMPSLPLDAVGNIDQPWYNVEGTTHRCEYMKRGSERPSQRLPSLHDLLNYWEFLFQQEMGQGDGNLMCRFLWWELQGRMYYKRT